MTTVEKALLTKELSKASAALQHAFTLASRSGNFNLASNLRHYQKAIATEITGINGGPVKLTAGELLRA